MTDRNGGRRSLEPLAVETDWSSGLRTPSWDELWRQIFADIADEIESDRELTGCTDTEAAPTHRSARPHGDE